MTKPLSPDIIYDGFLKGDLNKEKATELLISLIEMSEIAQIRIKSFMILKKVRSKNPKIYKLLEDYLVSDENALVRSKAVEVLLNNYTDEFISPIIWTLEHDKSPLVIKAIFDHFESITSSRYKLIKKSLVDWLEQFSSLMGINPLESIFFLDLEALFAKNKENYEIDPQGYLKFKVLSDFKGGEPWLRIKNKHVEILNFNFFNWKFIKNNSYLIKSLLKLNDLEIYLKSINKYNSPMNDIELPTSIGKLTYLKKLTLRRNNIQSIPPSIKNFTYLKELDLSYNKFNSIPPILETLRALEILNIKHNSIRYIPDVLKKYLSSLKKFRY